MGRMETSAVPKAKFGGATEQTVQRLLMMIICGELSPGEQVRQQEMAEQFGVSRVPLREALNVLAEQGLLQHRPNQGYFVTKRAPGELAQIRRMLHLLESEIVLSIAWPGEEVLHSLRAMNAQIRSLIDASDWSVLPRLNRDFHSIILELSPHRLIREEIQRLLTQADPFFAAKFERPAARAKTVDEHERIIDALAARDRTALADAMHLHRHSNAEGMSIALAEAMPGHASDGLLGARLPGLDDD
jgi:DNA-binding GntR family transcriptional regulator